ncbi:MAG: TIGR03960 family B12-binding radical SAM protein [Oscillospiraceae bacterium]|nr:TIGR03960 family B12-binding radical SAM protein [Oscillospiraceae bacterium]
MSFDQLAPFLRRVQKPARYIGGEPGAVNAEEKKKAKPLRYALCFPDTYEIGMSHLGMKILYAAANRRTDVLCERVFAPDSDMESEIRKANLPLWGLESLEPICAFDIIGFTLQYEMCCTNVLNMLDLAHIPLRASNRTAAHPIVIAGGPCCVNPEPLAPFFDVFVLGEGEEVQDELLDLLIAHKQGTRDRLAFLAAAAKLEGCYIPAIHTDPSVRIRKRIVRDLDNAFFPDTFVTPLIEVVQDRASTELFRGCIRGCRFCQAGFMTRPVRTKAPETAEAQVRSLCANTGYDEINLSSLSTSDYEQLPELLEHMNEWTVPAKIKVSVPSLRIDAFSQEVMDKLALVRRAGLTFAPEAGTQRLRDVINKNITEAQILDTVRRAFAAGWTSVKLYFMMGLPTETDEDITGIADLAQKVVDEFYRNPDKPKGKGVTVSVSVAVFVPKPCTPFQWEAMDSREEILRKQALLRASIRSRKISLHTHDMETGLLEGVFARGDRRLADVIETAWQNGAKFDAWDDRFQPDIWKAAFRAHGLTYAGFLRERSETEPLPWDRFDYGVSAAFLLRERKKAYAEQTTANCREQCCGCGAGCGSV